VRTQQLINYALSGNNKIVRYYNIYICRRDYI